MKPTRLLLSAVLLLSGLTACYDDYTHDYEGADMGFAIAKPLRTVIGDRDMSIYIGVSIGGKREIDMDDWAKFIIDPTLLNGTGKTLLPAAYYTLTDPEYFHVRKSNSPVADVGISFTNAFYSDPLCLTGDYALPFRMTENSMNALREGAETSVAVIKYISTYAGTYYRMGTVTETDATGTPIGEPTSYGDTKDINKCPTCTFNTTALRVVERPGLGNEGASVGNLVLTMDADRNVAVSGTSGGAVVTNATGSYTLEGDYDYVAKASTRAPQFNLEYTYAKAGTYYKVTEKLVLRQNPLYDLRVETW